MALVVCLFRGGSKISWISKYHKPPLIKLQKDSIPEGNLKKAVKDSIPAGNPNKKGGR